MSTSSLNRLPVVLLADDDPGDQELTERAFSASDVDVDLRIVENGEEALDYLNQRGAFEDTRTAPMPDLFIVDLNMPRIDGARVVETVRADARFRRLPIVVLSTSSADDDVNDAYRRGANTFITKPADFEVFQRVVAVLAPYWFRLVRLPRSTA